MNCKNCNRIINTSLSQKQFLSRFNKMYVSILPSPFGITDYCRSCLEMIEEDLKMELNTKHVMVTIKPFTGTMTLDYFGSRGTYSTNYGGFIDIGLADGVYILQPDSIECKAICNRFTSPAKILFIEKNVNRTLLSSFQNSICDGKVVNLFHGSSNDNFDSILKNGLLIEKSANGSLGIGIYGAENSKYSLGYSRNIAVKMTPEIKDALVNKEYANTTDNMYIKAMLLCDFILDNKSRNLNCGEIGVIHAVYNNNHVYPGYLIYFRDD